MEDLDELNNGIHNLSLGEGKSFLYSNLESAEYVALESRSDLGLVAIATKDVAVGTKIIREKPVMVYDEDNWTEMVSKFLALDRDSRNAVLGMDHSPSVSPTLHFIVAMVAHELSLDPALIHKLIAIDRFNAHKYLGSEHRFHREAPSALFLFGSKVAHSCQPNTAITSRASDGKLECVVLRPIEAGDMVTFSYMRCSLEIPTHIRRKMLMRTKEFLCRCPRCLGPDYSRPVHCTKCRHGVLLCTNPRGDRPVWACSGCGTLEGEEQRIERLENEIEEELFCLELLMDGEQAMPPSILKDQMKRCSSELHPHHYHNLRASVMYIRLCESYANEIEAMPILGCPPHVLALVQSRVGTPTKLRSECAKEGVSLVEAFECIAAGSTGTHATGRCTNSVCTTYAPVPDACGFAFLVAQDMLRSPASSWPARGRDTVHRYIPLMEMRKVHDEHIATIKKKIPIPKNVGEDGLLMTEPVLPQAVKKRANQRRKKQRRANKKKKGHRK